MTEERRYLDKYQVFDSFGYGTQTSDGIFRPIDVVEGNLIFQGFDLVGRRKNVEALQQEEEERNILSWRDVVEKSRKKSGRPRKHKWG